MSDSISFVTGASGFIASHVVQQLLDMGHKVHATVRRPPQKKKKKIQHPLDMQERWPSKLTLFKANFLVPGSFEAPMKGCLFSCLSCCIALLHQKHHL